MRSIVALLSLMAVGTFSLSSASAADSPKTILAKVGKTFTISLKSNPSTGFGWVTDFNKNYLTVVKSSCTYPSSSSSCPSGAMNAGACGMVAGQGCTQQFIFRAKKAGRTTLTLNYKRSWETNSIQTNTYDVRIK